MVQEYDRLHSERVQERCIELKEYYFYILSAKYFGDLVKKMTGDTAGNYIRQYIIQRAKNALAAGSDVARVSYDLGFEYPQHFSRMFKKQTGITPTEYCESLRRR